MATYYHGNTRRTEPSATLPQAAQQPPEPAQAGQTIVKLSIFKRLLNKARKLLGRIRRIKK